MTGNLDTFFKILALNLPRASSYLVVLEAMSAMETIPFADVRQGMKARVVEVPDGPDMKRLREMGLNEGVEFTVAKVAPFGDTIEIRLLNYALCLRKRDAEAIRVLPIPA